MKTYLLISVLLVSLLSGCVSSPKEIAYKTLASVGVAVDSAADSYALARYQGFVSDEKWLQAKVTHERFLVSYRAAVTLASGDVTKYAPEELVKLELEVLKAFAERN